MRKSRLETIPRFASARAHLSATAVWVLDSFNSRRNDRKSILAGFQVCASFNDSILLALCIIFPTLSSAQIHENVIKYQDISTGKTHLVFPHRLCVRGMILSAAGILRQLGELDRLENRFTQNAERHNVKEGYTATV